MKEMEINMKEYFNLGKIKNKQTNNAIILLL